MNNRFPPTLNPQTANLAINTCAGKPDPNGGPTLSIPQEWNRQRQYTGLWYDASKFPGFAGDALNNIMQQTPLGLSPVSDLVYAHAQAPSWWTIDLWGQEVSRFVEDGEPQISPLTRDEVINQGQRFTRMKARVFWENMQVIRSIDVDIGLGTRFSINANAVRVTALYPQDQRIIEVGTTGAAPQQTFAELFGPGLVIDTLVGASIYPCYSPLSNRYPTYTERFVMLSQADGGTSPIVSPVPPGSKYISIYPIGDSSLVPWQLLSGPDGSGLGPTAILDYDPTIRAVIRRPIPQNSQFIRLTGVTNETRAWEIVWELEL